MFGLNYLVASLSPFLEYVHDSKTENNPWSVVNSVDKLCRRLYPNSRVIIRPRWIYNYSQIGISSELYKISMSVSKGTNSKLSNAFNRYMGLGDLKKALNIFFPCISSCGWQKLPSFGNLGA